MKETLLVLLYIVTTLNSSQEQVCNFNENNIIWTPCGAKNVTETACTDVHKCCVAPDEVLKKRNWTEKCLKVSKSPGIQNGTCQEYSGSVCYKYFSQVDAENKTAVNKLRYIDTKIGMKRTDSIFGEFFQALEERSVSKKECIDILSPAMCKYGIPSCYEDNTPHSPCREDCEHIMELCKDDLSKLLGAIQYIALKERIDFAHLAIMDGCSSFQYSYEMDPESNKTCEYWFDSLDRSPPTATEKTSKALVAVIVAAAMLLITVVAVIFVLRHLGRKRKYKSGSDDFATSMKSIRDRIRQDSYVNPLLELLASSKPGELVQYPLDCVEYIRDLGEGQFGKVFQGRVHGVVKGEESTDVAVKCLKEGSSSNAVDEFHKEVALMSVLQHANILCLLAVSTEEEPYCMIFEFMENGDLNEYLRKWNGKEYLNDNDLIKICKHVAAGMEYLASKKFLHRDLATRNCLVGKDMIVKIADFGMSRNVYHSDYYRVGGEAMLPIRWMPPEAILYGKFTIAADVYSFGVVLWEIFSFALQPFYGYSNEEVVEFIKKGVLLPQPEDCPDWIYNIMLECWKREPEERITFSQAFKLLKGQFADYDLPPNRESVSSLDGYNVVTMNPPPVDSSYDEVPRKPKEVSLPVESSYDEVPRKPKEVSPPNEYYQNVDISREKAPSFTLETPRYQNVKPNKEKEPLYEQEKNNAQLNAAYDNETSNDELTKSLVSEKIEKDTNKSKSLPKVRKSIEKKVMNMADEDSKTNSFPRLSSLAAGRSIKDVLKEDARYVSAEKLQKGAEPADSSAGHIHPSFRPSSEFLQFHGYGENIQAADDDEKNMIKKIIDGSHSKRSSNATTR